MPLPWPGVFSGRLFPDPQFKKKESILGKMKEKETFFDKNTLISIALLGVCWLGWDSYMRKKYPHYGKGKTPVEDPRQGQKPPLVSPPGEKGLSAGSLHRKTHIKEKIQSFSGEKVDFQISSRGLGFKRIRLKSFTDRKGRDIVFESEGGRPLFATGISETGEVAPFQIRRRGNKFTGRYVSENLEIRKTLEVDEKNFVYRVQTDVIRHPPRFSGLSVFLHHKIPPSPPEPWYSKILFIAGRNISGGFVISEEGDEKLLKEDLKEKKEYRHLSILGFGNKYFGQAFINKSDLFPSGTLQSGSQGLFGEIQYRPLTREPVSLSYEIFSGPKSLEHLSQGGGQLKKWINFGFFEWLARPLLRILKVFYNFTGNWGVAVILLTFLIRLLLLPLNIRSYKSTKIMQKLQPRLQALREKYKDDPQTLNREMMAVMKASKANPLGGCLPILLVQLPVFFALYRVLGESIELYQAPFIFWITDLSLHDSLYVLPVLGGITLFVQQKMTPMNVSPAQARIFTLLPLFFSVFMLKLPAGLTLYIFVSGVFGLAQQFFFVKIKEEK